MIGPTVSSKHSSDTVDVHISPTPRDDEVDHMPVSGTRMHPGGLNSSYQFELTAQSQ